MQITPTNPARFRKIHKISFYFVDFSKSSGMGEEIGVWLFSHPTLAVMGEEII